MRAFKNLKITLKKLQNSNAAKALLKTCWRFKMICKFGLSQWFCIQINWKILDLRCFFLPCSTSSYGKNSSCRYGRPEDKIFQRGNSFNFSYLLGVSEHITKVRSDLRISFSKSVKGNVSNTEQFDHNKRSEIIF